MTSRQLDEEQIFHIAREIPNPEARASYIEQICAGDGALLERVEALLTAHEQDQSFLKSNGATDLTVDQPSTTESIGQEIGRYKLLQKIGEGGFGVVFMAEQNRPVRRKVAVKIIKPGMDTHAVVARFEAERQALALMDHTNIARVLDGGATDSGRPYFVMELVKGVPITEYCDKNELNTQDRLNLFTTVCHAVQHAHQKGIIHRDLKPSNILVTLHDGIPVVKVIDFGVAKATNQHLTEKTLFTAYGQMVGTPQYMSPEQAEMSGLDVDTRSDVYSLGVLLFELLTGTTPLEATKLRSAGYVEMQRMIREHETPKPSTRLSSSGDQLTIIAKHRSLTPEQLQRTVRGDLDWIVMKALEKERQRRYETPNSLADDVSRFLALEPVEACPPSPAYRLKKFVLRNRIVLATTGAVAIALIVATIVSSWSAWKRGLAEEKAMQNAATLKTTLTDLIAATIREAVLASFNGHEERARTALIAAEQADAPVGDRLLIEGVIALNAGDYEVAMQKAKESQEHGTTLLAEGERQLAADALYFTAGFWSGVLSEGGELTKRLVNSSPESPIAKLLVANAIAATHPNLALKLLKSESEIERTPVGLFVQSQARYLLAVDRRDRSELEQVHSDLEVVKFLLKDSEAAIWWTALTHALRMEYAQKDKRTQEWAQLQRLASSLQKEMKNIEGVEWVRWSLAWAADDLKTAAEACRDVSTSRVMDYVAYDCLMHGDYEQAMKRFEALTLGKDMSTKHARIARAHLAHANPNATVEIPRLVEDILTDEQEGLYLRYQALLALCLAEDKETIEKRATRMLESVPDGKHHKDLWRTREKLRYLAGEIKARDLLQKLAGHRYALAGAHASIAMKCLAMLQRDDAESHFQKAVQTETRASADYELAAAYLKRMESNKKWPSWLEQKEKQPQSSAKTTR